MIEKYKADLVEIYRSLSSEMDGINGVTIAELEGDTYKSCVLAAFVKCYQFNFDVASFESNGFSFYFSSFLRGMCEDLISLKFILRQPVDIRQALVREYIQYLIATSVQAQVSFFSKERPFQPVLSSDNLQAQIDNHTSKLNDIWKSLGYNKGRLFPSVEHMAIDSNLRTLYDYLYHATSRSVHFSPNVLMRTGWYDSTEQDPTVKFSSKNFTDYYTFFNCHYGANLFVEYITAFKKYLNLGHAFRNAVKAIEVVQQGLSFIPEIVTFDEVNERRPSNLEYLVWEMKSKLSPADQEIVLEKIKEHIRALPKSD